ncbi:hypothetical protein NMG60_11002502 [Bertholletia excelsa]
MVAMINVASNGCIEATRVKDENYHMLLKPKGTVKTIESEDGRDVIDCVDIYKQPAFYHPLINDLQVEPSSYPSGRKVDETLPEIIQDWRKNGECPDGTIPIRRTKKYDPHRHFPIGLHGRNFNSSLDPDIHDGHEYAIVYEKGGSYHGSQARINIWNPQVEENEMSISQMWVASNTQLESVNTIEAGWIVLPERYGDHQTRFFVYWTSDGYQTTGCYDLDCPGFVQMSKKFGVGSPIAPVSIYAEESFEILVEIFQDVETKNWLLLVQDELIGYWPGNIFTTLANDADELHWGGEIFDSKRNGHHTTTQMGSGHFPNEGYKKSSYFHNIRMMDNLNYAWSEPANPQTYVTNPLCYDSQIAPNRQGNAGTYFQYGGPGNSAQCP